MCLYTHTLCVCSNMLEHALVSEKSKFTFYKTKP